jgi:hypothetical protein
VIDWGIDQIDKAMRVMHLSGGMPSALLLLAIASDHHPQHQPGAPLGDSRRSQ